MHVVLRVVISVVRVFAAVAAVVLVAMMVVTFIEVVYRNVLNSSFRLVVGSVEILLVLMVYMGLAVTQRELGHVKVDALVHRLPDRPRKVLELWSMAVSIAVVGLFTAATFPLAVRSWQTGEARPGLVSFPMWPARFAVTVGFFLMGILMALQFAERLRSPRLRQTGPQHEW